MTNLKKICLLQISYKILSCKEERHPVNVFSRLNPSTWKVAKRSAGALSEAKGQLSV